MGQSREDFEKMRYVVFTEPLTEMEFFKSYTKDSSTVSNWHREPDDYNNLFKNDEFYKELDRTYKKAKKARDEYKEMKRKKV